MADFGGCNTHHGVLEQTSVALAAVTGLCSHAVILGWLQAEQEWSQALLEAASRVAPAPSSLKAEDLVMMKNGCFRPNGAKAADALTLPQAISKFWEGLGETRPRKSTAHKTKAESFEGCSARVKGSSKRLLVSSVPALAHDLPWSTQ